MTTFHSRKEKSHFTLKGTVRQTGTL